MRALERFSVGQRVHTYTGCRESSPHGTVVGFDHDPALIRVQRDGRSYDELYHVNHWKPCKKTEREAGHRARS